MKLLSCLLLFAVIAMSQGRKLQKPYYDINDAPALFEKYIKDFDRHYKNDADKELHYLAFIKTLIEVNHSNAVDDLATYDINGLSDYTPEEVEKYIRNGLKLPVHNGNIHRKRSNTGF